MVDSMNVLDSNKLRYNSFRDFYVENKTYVYKVALKVVKDEILAEDITQETFLNAFNAINNFKGQSSFKTWLYRITKNVAYSYLKKSSRKIERNQVEIENEVLYSPHNPEELCLELYRQEALRKEMKELTQKQRESLELRLLEGMGVKQIAEINNVTPMTIRLRSYEGAKKLRTRLADY